MHGDRRELGVGEVHGDPSLAVVGPALVREEQQRLAGGVELAGDVGQVGAETLRAGDDRDVLGGLLADGDELRQGGIGIR